jgi:NDP-sugar pyrophosphorylase family protein
MDATEALDSRELHAMLDRVRAMLLAAGEGQRLRTFTSDRPKPMLLLGGKPVLEHNVRLLAEHGCKEIAINLHHRPEIIRAHFCDGSGFGVKLRYSEEPELLGTAGAVKNLEKFFGAATFLVLYGDNLTDCRLDRLLAMHREKRADCTVAVFHREDVGSSGIVEMDEDGRVGRFLEKPAPDQVFSRWVNAGVLAVEPSVLNWIPAGRAADFGRDVLPALLAASRPVYAYPMRQERLLWIDSPEDYRRAQQQMEQTGFGGSK